MSAPEVQQHQIEHDDVTLNVLELGDPQDPVVVMVHGLRDTAWALLPIAQPLVDEAADKRFRVLITELRGHGASSISTAYGVPNFLLDLYAVTQAFNLEQFALVGHSLGGHITAKYAALFPEQVPALMLIEGMGPPKRPHEGNETAEMAAYRTALLARLGARAPRTKPITGTQDVAARLCRNNPRLDPDEADRLAPHLIKQIEGEFEWSFDPRASSVFIGSGTDDNARFWRQIKAPTCLVSGAQSYEYWGREMQSEDFTGHFAEGELEARAALIPQHEHHWFENAGHMVHYDQPLRLAKLCRTFLEQNYV